MIDNSKYLKALLDGDSKLIKAIYKKNFPSVLSFIFKNSGQQEDAEDIFQKALMQLAVRYKKEKFEINTSFNAYLFTVCKNLWRRELNKKKIRVTKDDIFELKDNNDDIALSALEQRRWDLFTEYLERLSENCNKIMKLFFKRVPYSEIVKVFEYSSETVARQRIFKCKTKLKELIVSDKRFNDLLEL